MTREEFIAQLNAEGVTDQTTRNQRISQAIASGQITGASAKQEPSGWAERLTQPAPEAEPAPTEVPAPVESPLGGGAGYALIQAAQPAKAEGLTPTFQTEAEKAQAEQAAQAQPALYQPGQEPGAAGTGMPRMPSVGLPGTGPLQATVQAVPGAFKEAEEGYSEAYGKLKKAVGEKAEAQKEIAGAQAGVFEEQRKVSEELHAAQFEREQERRMVMDREVGKVRDSIEEINKAGVDPYRFYRHSDGSVDYPKSIASAIAVGLGALGSSLPRQYGGTGGPNMALQIIERAIDRDISAQRDDLTNRRAGVGLGMNLLGQMRGKFADERQAESASRAVMLDHYKIKLQEALAKTSNKKIAANAQKEIAAVDIKQAEVLGDIGIKAAIQEVAGEEKMLTAETRAAGLRQRQAIAQYKARAAAAGAGAVSKPVKGFNEFRPVDDKERKEARLLDSMVGETVRSLEDLMAMRRDVGSEAWPAYVSANRARLDTARQDLFMQVKEAYKLGALQEHEMIFMEKMIPDAASFGHVMPQLKVMHRKFKARFNRQMENLGYKPQAAAIKSEGKVE